MEDEVRGYQVESCFASGGCPNQAVDPGETAGLPEELEDRLREADIRSFLKARVNGPLKFHHEFRIVVAGCPNACSRPQIADIGLIGASTPEIAGVECSRCGACLDACKEGAVNLDAGGPAIDRSACLRCGDCVRTCPTGALAAGDTGYRILIGGKLGRHPRLGAQLPGLHDVESVLKVLERCLAHYRTHCIAGERFGEILEKTGDGEIRTGVEKAGHKEAVRLDLDQRLPAYPGVTCSP
jgi:dissimilatory sulfite reductase (desulfoviridin) alpha/beta subunit